MKRKKQIENTKRIMEEYGKMNTDKYVITGGICINSYINGKYRRFSNDMDLVTNEPPTIEDFKGPYSYFGTTYWIKKIDDELKIYLILDKKCDLREYKIKIIPTFNEFFNEEYSYIKGKVFGEQEILYQKLKIIGPERGLENIKDAYDIFLLLPNMKKEELKNVIKQFDEEKIKEIGAFVLSSELFEEGIKEKISPSIASGNFPKKIFRKGLDILKREISGEYTPKKLIYFSTIFPLSRKKVKEVSEELVGRSIYKVGVFGREVWKKLENAEDTKINELSNELIENKNILEVLGELFTS